MSSEEKSGEIMVSTAFDIPCYKVIKNIGIVRGIVVRSRSLFGTTAAAFQTILGGNITLFTSLCEKTRQEAFDIMLANAKAINADGIIGMRYDSTEVMDGVTEVLAYGTAVKLEEI
jgi:uncharacterized protein YbjQ (UPF0145 family)